MLRSSHLVNLQPVCYGFEVVSFQVFNSDTFFVANIENDKKNPEEI